MFEKESSSKMQLSNALTYRITKSSLATPPCTATESFAPGSLSHTELQTSPKICNVTQMSTLQQSHQVTDVRTMSIFSRPIQSSTVTVNYYNSNKFILALFRIVLAVFDL